MSVEREADGIVRVTLLGPVSAAVGGHQISLSRQQALVVSLLAVRLGRTISTDELVDRAWSGQPPPTARSALRVQLARLRQKLEAADGDPLPHGHGGYQLNPDVVRTDLQELAGLRHALATATDPDAILRLTEQALALWCGEPFTGFTDDELRIEAGRLEEARLELEDARIEALLALGRHTDAVTDLVPLVAAQPMREHRSRQLMLALYRCGRQSDALTAYRNLSDRLLGELGVDPARETRQLELDVLRHDPRLSWAEPPESEPDAELPLGPPPDHHLVLPTPQLVEVISERLATVSPEARQIVSLVCLMDGFADDAVLATALDLTINALQGPVAEAIGAPLIARENGFFHPVPYVYESVMGLIGDVATLRTTAANALLQRGSLPFTVRGAWLLLTSDAPADAVQAAVLRAAETCLQQGEPEAADALCEAVLVRQLPPATEADLLICRTRALAMLERTVAADQTWAGAVAAARSSEDPARLALAALARDWVLRSITRPSDSIPLLTEALTGLGDGVSTLRVRVMWALAFESLQVREHVVSGEVVRLVAEIERLAGRTGDAEALADAATARVILLRGTAELEERRRLIATAKELLVGIDPYPSLRGRLLGADIFHAFVSGELSQARLLAEELLEYAESIRSGRFRWHHALTQASLHREIGDFDAANRWADQGAILGAAAGIPDALPAAAMHRLMVAFHKGSTAQFVPIIEEFLRQHPTSTMVGAIHALSLADAGRDNEAREVLHRVLAAPTGSPPDETHPITIGLLAQAAIALTERDVIEPITAALTPFSGQFITFGQVSATFGPADRLLGGLSVLSGDLDAGVRLLKAAEASAHAAGTRPWVDLCRASLSRIRD